MSMLDTPVPLDAFQRRADWQLATLLIALVLVPGAVDAVSDRPVAKLVTAANPVTRPGGRGQPVRPPRSC
jgi:hypothetical protein